MRHFFSIGSAVFIAFAYVSLPCYAERVDPDKCNVDWSDFPRSGCVEIDRWCEVTRKEPTITDDGEKSFVEDYCTLDHCDDKCADCEDNAPSPAEYSCSVTMTFAQSKKFEVMGGIEGSAGWLVADLKAKLEVTAGHTNTWTGSVTRGVNVTLQYCEWQKYKGYIEVRTGRKASASAEIQPKGYQVCDGTQYFWSGPTIKGTVTGTFDVVLTSEGGIGLHEHGVCPPDPSNP